MNFLSKISLSVIVPVFVSVRWSSLPFFGTWLSPQPKRSPTLTVFVRDNRRSEYLRKPVQAHSEEPEIPPSDTQEIERGKKSGIHESVFQEIDEETNSLSDFSLEIKDLEELSSVLEEFNKSIDQSLTLGKSILFTNKKLESFRAKYLKFAKSDVNIYEDFIEKMRYKDYAPSMALEKHHIVPKHAGGTENSTNIIKLTQKQHTFAHLCRFIQYGEKGDSLCFLFRQKQTDAAIALRSKFIVERNKKNKVLFWSSSWQSQQGKKGGSKGGSANTEKQFLARQKIGQKHGFNVGVSNQKAELIEKLKHKWKWVYNRDKINKTVITMPSETFQQVVNQLNKEVPESITNSSSFMKVFNKERKQLYGWELVGKVIRSEAEGGLGPSERSETSA